MQTKVAVKVNVTFFQNPFSSAKSPGMSPLQERTVLVSGIGGNASVIFQSSLFTVMLASDVRLSEEAIHARQTSVLAGQGSLNVFIRRQLRQVSQSGHGRLAAQHLGGHSLDVTCRHITWTKFGVKSNNEYTKKKTVYSDLRPVSE